ncbi:DUF2690 domain-containing protein [Herbidospora cretacea]|uniref:DUF2690 domain-containing protein n=1 Tax=Herbidospora cretacea TaxID=28444 RepID=UPI000773365B|nr:DUF2690 domain-containing protein [Herbidospora cretacea]
MLRRLLAALTATATALFLIPVLTSSPSAAAQALACSYNSCTGQNPTAHGCNATLTPEEMFLHGMYTVQLRYSAPCSAFFARVVRDDCSLIQGMAWVKVERQIRSPYGWYTSHNMYRVQSGVPCNGGTGWSYMVPNNIATDDRFRACFSNYITTHGGQSSIPASSWTCTPFWGGA